MTITPKDTLIEKLVALKHNALTSTHYYMAVDDCITIVRQHTHQEGDVERVAEVIQHHDDNYGGAWFEQRETVKNDFRQTARAVLKALQHKQGEQVMGEDVSTKALTAITKLEGE